MSTIHKHDVSEILHYYFVSVRDGFGFYPRPVWAAGYCHCLPLSVCLSVCVNHDFRAIICHPFEVKSPNLGLKCKTTCVRSVLFLGLIDLPNFKFVHTISHHHFKLKFKKLDKKHILALLRSIINIIFELDWPRSSISFSILKDVFFLPNWDKILFVLFLYIICDTIADFQVTLYTGSMKDELKISVDSLLFSKTCSSKYIQTDLSNEADGRSYVSKT